MTDSKKLETKLSKLKEKVSRIQTKQDEAVAERRTDVTIKENILEILTKRHAELEELKKSKGLSMGEYENLKLVEIQLSSAQKMLRKAKKRYARSLEKRDREITKVQRKIFELEEQLEILKAESETQ